MLKLRDGKRNRNYHTAVKSVATQVSRKKRKSDNEGEFLLDLIRHIRQNERRMMMGGCSRVLVWRNRLKRLSIGLHFSRSLVQTKLLKVISSN